METECFRIEGVRVPLERDIAPDQRDIAPDQRDIAPERMTDLREKTARAIGVRTEDVLSVRIIRRGLDARKDPVFVYTLEAKVRKTWGKGPFPRRCDTRRVHIAQPVPVWTPPEYIPFHGTAAGVPADGTAAGGVPSHRTAAGGVPSYGTVGVPADEPPPIVVGAGPAGLFAALILARAGLRPILLERGRTVEQRLNDVEHFRRTGRLHPASNVQFGEGGAGAFSDGKLHTGTRDIRHRFILEQFVRYGAPESILTDAQPHIGTDYLRVILRNLRQDLLSLGTDIRFEHTLTRIHAVAGQLHSVSISGPSGGDASAANGETFGKNPPYGSREMAGKNPPYGSGEMAGKNPPYGSGEMAGKNPPYGSGITSGVYEQPCRRLILCPGHSARDTFRMLYDIGVPMESKAFAVGVRIEHRQCDCDAAQYHAFAGHPGLPPASYKLSCRTDTGRGVYSFCVCPGGEVIAAASEPGRLVTNGMSVYARDGKNINGGLLVGVTPADFHVTVPGGGRIPDNSGRIPDNGGRILDNGGWIPEDVPEVLSGIAFQERLEEAAFALGGGNFHAPAQRVGDFLARRASTGPGRVQPTYQPGVVWTNLWECLPEFVSDALAYALPVMGRALSGYDHPDAVLTAVESRSSSPVRILRNTVDCQCAALRGVYPCGEGAGYAGGIMSAAADGIRCAERVCAELRG